MSKKNKFFVCMTLAFACVMSAFALTSCGEKKNTDSNISSDSSIESGSSGESSSSEEESPDRVGGAYEVTFMVRENGTGDYKQYGEKIKSDKNGVLVLPNAPVADGYDFRGWFIDEECKKVFDHNKVTEATTVYGLFVDKVIDVNIITETGALENLKEQKLKELDNLKATYDAKAEEKNLVFEGWFTNKECTTPYTEKSGTTEIFGAYKAQITYDNGYEILNETRVFPGQKAVVPELSEIKKNYMDDTDIFYVDPIDNVTEFNFNNEIKQNTVIKVLWKTPGLSVKPIDGTNYFQTFGPDTSKSEIRKAMEEYPVISIPSRITIDSQVVDIAVVYSSNLNMAKSAKKIIYAEGIKYINGLSGPLMGTSLVEEVDLPASLRIIEGSFKKLDSLKKVNIPEGLEVIIDCFWKDYDFMHSTVRNAGYDFDITIPKSVEYMSLVPTNLKFAEGSTFVNDGYCVYKNDAEYGKVLVSQHKDGIKNGNLTVAEGVQAITPGIFDGLEYEYLELPSTFNKVRYIEKKSEYDFYTGNLLTIMSDVSEPASNPMNNSGMDVKAYSIVSDLEKHDFVKFDSEAFPEGMNKYAFNGYVTEIVDGEERTARVSYDEFDKINVVFVADKVDGTVDITVNWVNSNIGVMVEDVVQHNVGDILTEEKLFEDLGITKELLGYDFKLDECTQFAKDFVFGEKVSRNLYLDIVISYSKLGVLFEENDKGTITITGFDKANAQNIGSEEDPKYLVIVPGTINGKVVTDIKENAFINNEEIGRVTIANTVKTIGANAFKNTARLESVVVEAGGLETIGAHAFEYAGCVKSGDKYEVNGSLPLVDQIPTLIVEIPLANLKSIEPYAFNTPALREFTAVESEKSRPVLTATSFSKPVFEENQFYYHKLGKNWGILKAGKVGTVTKKDASNVDVTYDIQDFDFLASAGGYVGKDSLGIGMNATMMNATFFYRYTVKEGSIAIYEGNLANIEFANIKYIEKNGFVYMNDKYFELKEGQEYNSFEYIASNTCFVFNTMDEVVNQSADVFAEGWYMGRANSLNDFMTKMSAHSNSTPGFN